MAEALGQTTMWGQLQLTPDGYVGIDTLQEQIRRKVLRRGFEFNIMVVGRSGLGKSTLVNTLFKSKVSRVITSANDGEIFQEMPKTTQVKSVSHVIEENGCRLRLTVTDTPGFGDQVNNDKCWMPILDHISRQFEKYLKEEQSYIRKRSNIADTRIHCCLYFVEPTGHSLRPLDIEVMKQLDKVVNIIPVVAKSDTLTVEEREEFKAKIRQELKEHNIQIYPSKQYEEPEDFAANESVRAAIPYAVVGSAGVFEGKLGRKTHWGLIEVENLDHCEFSLLRDILIRTHMQDLVDLTSCLHYETFRQEKLLAENASSLNGSIITNGHHDSSTPNGKMTNGKEFNENTALILDNIDSLNESSL